MSSEEENEISAVGEAGTSTSASSPTNINEELSATPVAVPGSSKDLNNKLCPTKYRSKCQSKATSALSSVPSAFFCSRFVDASISSQDSAISSSPSISSPNLHLKDTVSSPDGKCSSCSHLDPNISDDEPKMKKYKFDPLKISVISNKVLFCRNMQKSSERIIDNKNPIDDSDIIIDCVKENNSKELGNLETASISELIAEQQFQIDSSSNGCSSPLGNGKIDFDCSNSNDQENEDCSYFSNLPTPIMEDIFSQLPFGDLMKLSSVCKKWNKLIMRPMFLRWKKIYHDVKFKQDKSKCLSIILTYFERKDVKLVPNNCFSYLLSFINEKFERKPPPGIKTCLREIPSCVLAERVLLECFPDKKLECENPWCILTVKVILSSTIEDLYYVFDRLINVYHCGYVTILEFMFCIATVFLHFIRKHFINHGIHYRLLHVIYLLENKLPAKHEVLFPESEERKLPEEQSLQEHIQPYVPDIQFTYEQVRILNHKLAPSQIVKIFAFAGTGKTTTLLHYAKKHSNLRFLYISSRKPSQRYAAMLFPPNVDCRTIYSLAHAEVGKLYEPKLKTELKPDDIYPYVHKWPLVANYLYNYARSILRTIDKFIKSGDECITLAHIQDYIPQIHSDINMFNQDEEDENIRQEHICNLIILNEAQELWEKMVSLDNEHCKITPTMFLKIFLLRQPSFQGYDCIMIDEAEGLNAAVLQYFISLKIPLFLAGDSNQKIRELQFESAPWPIIHITHRYHLTQSFRLGHEIAYMVNCCSDVLTRKTETTLIGSVKESYVDGTIKGQYAIITCSIKELFSEAFRLCCTSQRRPNEPQQFKGAFVGGLNCYGLDQLVDIYKLRFEPLNHIGIKCELIRRFRNFFELESYAYSKDKDLLGKVNIVRELGSCVLEYIKIVKDVCSYDLEEAEVVFSRVQNVKGLEFETVCLTSDYSHSDIATLPPFMFAHYMFQTNDGVSLLKNDYCHIYTAVTRAKKCLIIPDYLYLIVLQTQEEFQFLAESSTLLEDSVSLNCILCSEDFTPTGLLTMFCKNLFLSDGRQVSQGPVCRSCASSKFFRYNVNVGPTDQINNHYNFSMSAFLK